MDCAPRSGRLVRLRKLSLSASLNRVRQISPIACPSCRYMRVTISWSTPYLTRCPRRASPMGGSVISNPAWTIAFREAAIVGTGRSRAAAISALVAVPCSRRYPMMPALTRLPRALMGSSSHSLHPPGTGVTRLGMSSIVSRRSPQAAHSQVDVLTIHSWNCMPVTSTHASAELEATLAP